MAIYSCNLKSIGRTTHEAGTAGAHIRYISRPDAEPVILSEHMPFDPVQARTWIDNRERGLRKNGRVIDKVRLALPRELSKDQRRDLVRTYMKDLTGGNIPWYAAIHQSGKDAHNPHVHIAVHDRDIHSQKRLLRLSDSTRDRRKAGLPGPKAVNWIRERWEVICNEALEKAGHEVRIDRRTLEAQGIDRQPTIHEGPRAQHIHDNVERPQSKQRINGCGRVIDYPFIDQGRTRREFNAHILDINLAKAAQGRDPVTVLWAQYEREQHKLDQALENRLAEEKHKRTEELRLTSLSYQTKIKTLRAERNLKTRAALRKLKDKHDQQRQVIRARHHKDKLALKDKQSRLHIQIFAWLDFTGITRKKMEAARKRLSKKHRQERRAFQEQVEERRRLVEEGIKATYKAKIDRCQAQRLEHLSQLKNHHDQLENFADHERQKREAEHEHMREITERKVQDWKKRERLGQNKAISSDFAAAIEKVAKQQSTRNKTDKTKDRDKDHDNDREM